MSMHVMLLMTVMHVSQRVCLYLPKRLYRSNNPVTCQVYKVAPLDLHLSFSQANLSCCSTTKVNCVRGEWRWKPQNFFLHRCTRSWSQICHRHISARKWTQTFSVSALVWLAYPRRFPLEWVYEEILWRHPICFYILCCSLWTERCKYIASELLWSSLEGGLYCGPCSQYDHVCN